MKKFFTSLLAIILSCVCMYADDTPPADITSDNDTNGILGDYTFVGWADTPGTGEFAGSTPSNTVIDIYDDYQTNIYVETTSNPTANYQNWYLWFDTDAQGTTIVVRADNYVFGDGLSAVAVTYNISWTDWDAWLANTAKGAAVISVAKTEDTTITISIVFHDGNTEVYTLTFNGGYVPSSFKMGGESCTYTISQVTFTDIDIDPVIKKDTYYEDGLTITKDAILNANMTKEIAIYDDKQTNVTLNLTAIGSTYDYETFAYEIYDANGWFATLLANGNGWWCCETADELTPTITTRAGGTVKSILGATVLTIKKIDDYNIKAIVTYSDNTTVTQNVYYPGGNYVATSFHMGGENCTYTINSITFTDIEDDEDEDDGIIKEDTKYEDGWEIDGSTVWTANLTGLIALKDNTQTNVHFTMNEVGLNNEQSNSFIFETSLNGVFMSATGNNNIWGSETEAKYPNYWVDPAKGDYVLSVAKVDDNVIRVYVQTPEGVEDYIWEQTFTSTEDISTFYMGTSYCKYTITSIDFTNIKECNTSVESMKVYSGLIYEDTVFDPAINLYASYGFSPAISPVTFPITKGTTTSVNFTAQPFILDEYSYRNFNFETIATEQADGIALRADAWENYTYTAGTNAVNTPTSAITKSWDDNDYTSTCKNNPYLTLTASITSNSTLEFNVYWYADEARNTEASAWETYVVTYPSGVPDDLTFHIGAEGSIMTLTSVSFKEIEPAIVTVIDGNSSPEENPFINCTKTELGTATITLNFDYKAIADETAINFTFNYEGNENSYDYSGAIYLDDNEASAGTITIKGDAIITAFKASFGEGNAPDISLRDFTLLTFEGTFGSGITLTGYDTDYTEDELFPVTEDTTFGEDGDNEWEIRTIGTTELVKSGEIDIKDTYQTTIEYNLDLVGYGGAMSVEIIDENGYSVVLHGTGYCTVTAPTEGNANENLKPSVTPSISGSLLSPSEGPATFTIAKVGGNTIEAVFSYGEEESATSVTFTITYPDYEAVKSFHIGGSNCAYTVSSVTFSETELTLTIIDTENDVDNPFSEAVEDDEWNTVKIQLAYEYYEIDEATPSIDVTANYTDNTGNNPLTGTIELTEEGSDQITLDGTTEIEITQEMIFTALGISEDPTPSVTLGDFNLLTLTGKNGLLLTEWHWTYTPTVNNFATLYLIGTDPEKETTTTVFEGLTDTEIGTATIALILTNAEADEVTLTVTATYVNDDTESTELTGTITVSDLVTNSGSKTGSFTMADIKTALTANSTVTDIDWSNVTALSLSVESEGEYKNVQLRGASVTSYTISSNKEYADGWTLGCGSSEGNLTGEIALLADQQTNIKFEMTYVGTQDQDDTFSLTLNDMLCEGNNAISGNENAVRYPNYNIDPVEGEYTLSIANVDGTYRIYVATPESIEDFVWEATFTDAVSTFTMGGTWCQYTISEITYTEIDECATAIDEMPEYATGLIAEATTFSPVINVYGSYGKNSTGSNVTFPVTSGYMTSVNFTMQPFTRVNATPTVNDNYVIETIATSSADGVTMLFGNVTTYTSVEGTSVAVSPSYESSFSELSSDEVIAMCKTYTSLTVDASIVDEKTVKFVVTWNDDNDPDTPVATCTYTIEYPSGVPTDGIEFQVGADGAITTLTSVSFSEIIIENDDDNDDGKGDEGGDEGGDQKKDDDTTGDDGNTPGGEGEDGDSDAISNVNVPVLEVARYNLLGQRIIAPQRGINIIVYSDGSTKKVLVK